MALCLSTVWVWGGYPESGRALYRVEELVADSCEAFKEIGLTRPCGEIAHKRSADFSSQE